MFFFFQFQNSKIEKRFVVNEFFYVHKFQSIGHISEAHLNPAVTLCSYVLKRISLKTTFVYLSAEILGSVSGFWLLKVSFQVVDFADLLNKNDQNFFNTLKWFYIKLIES